MKGRFKILLCAVPFGCDNIGDEAILACAVAIFRRLFPEAELAASTFDGSGTEKLLGIQTIPLYKFKPVPEAPPLTQVVAGYDLLVWCGATGLSDYPEAALEYIDAAREVGVPSVVWNTGMNSELNPALFSYSGRKRELLKFLGGMACGLVDPVSILEERKVAAARRHIAGSLSGCAFVAVRDPESRDELETCGFHNAMVGADSALRLESLPLPERYRSWLADKGGGRRIGVCISQQRKLSDPARFVGLLDRLSAAGDQILFIPMNPVTDRAVMHEMQREMRDPSGTLLLEDVTAPGEVQAAAATCDAILSSRLHLLIFASNVNVFPVGLERGSKVSNFLANFGLSAAGSVDDWNADRLFEILREPHSEFAEKCAEVHENLIKRLDSVEAALSEVVAALPDRRKGE
ncbi:MAG: polysaccharide pyruvyl transferase family protein [Victivallaceae bacterium]|nr:polysaccharide pyruvyl transferase family protein [Victivallaceae bacterium]